MSDKHMKRCSTSLVIKKQQFKKKKERNNNLKPVWYLHIPVRMVKIKRQEPSAGIIGEDVEYLELSYMAGQK